MIQKRKTTNEQIAFIVDNAGKMKDKEIADALGVTLSTVIGIRNRRGLPSTRMRWDKRQREFLKAHYRVDMPTKKIAEELGVTLNQVYNAAYNLGLVTRHPRHRNPRKK